MRNFKEKMENLGYTFQSADVLEDFYQFYRFYNNDANKGVTSILLEGDPGSGKTYLSEIFFKFLCDDGEEKDVEYLYTQCVDETNSEKLIDTYNVPAIVKGDADLSVAAGILTKAINDANDGKTVVLTIDELDKAREALDAYFLDFLQRGRIETSNNKELFLTAEGRKRLFVIFAKNTQRDLLDALISRCLVIKLPPMPPVLVYKTLLRNFNGYKHDPKFLKFICKVYEALYNEQMQSNMEFLNRLPALRELTAAITGDYELYENGVSSTRRIGSLIRKLGKDNISYEKVTNILIKKFKYQNQESNYTNETLNLDMDNPDDYMSVKDSDSLVEKYIEKKDNGEYIFEEDEFEDPMKDIASILDNMKDDQALVFLNKENKEKIVELGVITHSDPRALELLFEKIKFKGNPNSRFGFLSYEGDNFVGLMKYKNTLVLIANKEYVSPKLLMDGLCNIITIIYDFRENNNDNNFYFSEVGAKNFRLTGLNAKILSNIPSLVVNKMHLQNGVHTYQVSNLKVTYDDSLNISYFRYLQRYEAEPFYEAIEKICRFNPELAIPAAFINARKFNKFEDKDLVRKVSFFDSEKRKWQKLESEGWKVEIDEFIPMDLPFFRNDRDYDRSSSFVFDWNIEKDEEKKRLHVYPKYRFEGQYLVYTSDEDFENDNMIKQLNTFQKEIAFVARSIFGNFVPQFFIERKPDYFSSLTMSQTGRILENKNNRNMIPGIENDITQEQKFISYYNSISQPSAFITPDKVLKKV